MKLKDLLDVLTVSDIDKLYFRNSKEESIGMYTITGFIRRNKFEMYFDELKEVEIINITMYEKYSASIALSI